ncbi:transmembrane protein 154 isoform 2-T2 [Mantella aurantiaca]
MRSNSCTFCRLLLFAGFFYHGKLMSTDGDYQTNMQGSYTTALESTEFPSTPSAGSTIFSTVYGSTNDSNEEETDPSESPPSELINILICVAPVIFLILLLPVIFCIIRHKRRKKHEEDYSPKEDVKSPIFEEDTPSVMEIEMEDLDKWMSSIKNNTTRLSTLEEENKFSTSVES